MSEQGKKILIIDDEPAIIVYLQTLLEDNGYETCSATDAIAGIDVAREESPDLICLDIMMPKRSGIALYQEFKLDSSIKDIPVMFVSAFSEIHDLRRSHTFRKLIPDERIPEPEACMEKPINIEHFLDTISSILNKKV